MSPGTDQCLQENFGRQMVQCGNHHGKSGVCAAIQEAGNSKQRVENNVIAEGISAGGSKAIPQVRTQRRCGATTVGCDSSRPRAACIKREYKGCKYHMVSSPPRVNHRGMIRTCPLRHYRQSSPDHLDTCVLVLVRT